MKKKVLASLLCASMVATMFAGCGSGNGGNGTEKADKKDGGKETITVMGPAEDLDDAQGAWLKTECEAFAKANPDFNIEFKYVTSSESDAKDVVTKDPKAAKDALGDVMDQVVDVNGIKLLATSVDGVDMNGLRDLGDSLKEKLGEGVIVLASSNEGKVNLVAMATDAAIKSGAHAGNLIKAIASKVGGGGGGRPNMAQAGGKNPAGIPDAIASVKDALSGMIK